jgi:hypothetical protein
VLIGATCGVILRYIAAEEAARQSNQMILVRLFIYKLVRSSDWYFDLNT